MVKKDIDAVDLLARIKSLEVLCDKAFNYAIEAHIKITAMEKTTHHLYPVGVDTKDSKSIETFEKMLKKNMGVGSEDFEGDLARAGADEDPEDLV